MIIHCTSCQNVLTAQQIGEPCPYCGSRERDISGEQQAIFEEKSRVAKELARKHYEVEPGLARVIRFSGSADVEGVRTEPIKLLEVNQYTVPSGVMPLRFGPAVASGITFPSVIVEVTPEEFEKIHAKQMPLPPGWTVEDELAKPGGSGGA